MIWLWLTSAPKPFEGHELILGIILLGVAICCIWLIVSVSNELRRK